MKITLPIMLLAGLLAAVFESEGWAMVAVAALLLTPFVQGIINGVNGKPKEELTASDYPCRCWWWW
jgi:hypothetical protein